MDTTDKHSTDNSSKLSYLISAATLVSILIVTISSMIFYQDPRSKYDLVRPGRRDLPETFYEQNNDSDAINSREDLLLELQDLSEKLDGLNIYGEFNNDALSDYKVLQEFLNEPPPTQ